MEALDLAQRHAFRMKNVSNFFKSWLIFKKHALEDDLMRSRIADGYKPWKFNHPAFSFNLMHCSYVMGNGLLLTEARDEWNCYFERWFMICFRNPFVLIVRTETMGLGIVAKIPCSFDFMSQKVDGFLEFVTFHQISGLRIANYNSLFNFIDENGIQHWCILFGPLSLVNSDETLVHVGLSNYDQLGKELFWETCYSRSRYTVVQNAGSAFDEMTITGFYSSFNFVSYFDIESERGSKKGDDDEEERSSNHDLHMLTQFGTVGELLTRRTSMFNRVKMSYTRNGEAVHYTAGEELKITYML